MEPIQTTFTSNTFTCTQQPQACSTVPVSPCLHHFHYVLYYHPCMNVKYFFTILTQTFSSKHFIGTHSSCASTSCSSIRIFLCIALLAMSSSTNHLSITTVNKYINLTKLHKSQPAHFLPCLFSHSDFLRKGDGCSTSLFLGNQTSSFRSALF